MTIDDINRRIDNVLAQLRGLRAEIEYMFNLGDKTETYVVCRGGEEVFRGERDAVMSYVGVSAKKFNKMLETGEEVKGYTIDEAIGDEEN